MPCLLPPSRRSSTRPARAISTPPASCIGFTRGKPLAECARLGGIAAAEIISHVGARPETALKDLI